MENITQHYQFQASLTTAWLVDRAGHRIPNSTIPLYELRNLCIEFEDDMDRVIEVWIELAKLQHRMN